MSSLNNSYNTIQCPFCSNQFMININDSSLQTCPSCEQYIMNETNHNEDDFPVIMNDGRFITNYGSTNELVEQMRKLNGIQNSNQFRNFLQKNALEIMNSEREYILRNNTTEPKISCSEGWNRLWN